MSLALVARSRNAESAPPLPKQPDTSALVTNPPPATPPGPTAPVGTTAKKDSIPRPARTVGTLEVNVPDNATVSINGRQEAIGGWRNDSLKPQTYQVSATVEAPAGCVTATQSRSVIVRAVARATRVTLSPRSCGTLSFDAIPPKAQYTLTSLTPADSGLRRTGTLPVTKVVLPVGDYLRVISQPRCAPYGDTITVETRDKTLPVRRIFCS